jgi:hypothetical protein
VLLNSQYRSLSEQMKMRDGGGGSDPSGRDDRDWIRLFCGRVGESRVVACDVRHLLVSLMLR